MVLGVKTLIHKFESFSVRQPISLLLFLQSKPTLILLDGISLIVSFFDSKTLFFSFYLFIFQKQHRKIAGRNFEIYSKIVRQSHCFRSIC